MNTLPLRIMVAVPRPITCKGICALIAQQPDMEVAGQTRTGVETIDLFSRLYPDALVMEWDFPDMDGKSLIVALKARIRQAHILVLSNHAEDEIIYAAIKAGAHGFFPEDVAPETLIDGIRRVSAGITAIHDSVAQKMALRISTPDLTGREREILQFVADGKTNRDISADLTIAVGTVKSHLNTIFSKLGVIDRTQCVLVALKRGLAKLN